MIIDANNPPPFDKLSGCVHSVERGIDPWHQNAFPTELQCQLPTKKKRIVGWFLLDWCGNQIGFIPDGTNFLD